MKNGLIQIYHGRKCVDQTSVPGSPSAIVFGQLGQEEHVLVIITIGMFSIYWKNHKILICFDVVKMLGQHVLKYEKSSIILFGILGENLHYKS